MTLRDDKAASQLVTLAAEFIAREAGRTTLITPIRAMYGNDRKRVIIYVSVFPESDTEHALSFLFRNTDLFREYLKKHGRFGVLPFVKFASDHGEQNRQRLDEISKEL